MLTLTALLLGGLAPATAGTTRSGEAPAAEPSAGVFHPVPARRVLDTYVNASPARPAPGQAVTTGFGGAVPDDATAVVLNLTVRGPRTPGHLTAWPHGAPQPAVSSLNFAAGQTVANAVVVRPGDDGTVDVLNGSTGALDVVVDVTGYFAPPAPGADPAAGRFVAGTPARVLDTRESSGTVPAGGTRSVPVAGRDGVPQAGASAVLLNLTTTRAAAAGYLTAWGDGARPGTSSVVFGAGSTTATLALVPLGEDGHVSLFNGSTKPVDVVADVAGYVEGGSAAPGDGSIVPVTPTRFLDTRSAKGAPTPAARHSADVKVLGTAGVPAREVSAVVVSLTATREQKPGYLTAYATGESSAGVSTLNFIAARTVGNLAVVPVGSDGRISVLNGSAGRADIVGDVVGYVAQPAGSQDPAPGLTDCWAAGRCVSLQSTGGHVAALATDGTGRHAVPGATSAGFLSCPTATCQMLEVDDRPSRSWTFHTRAVDGSWTSRVVKTNPPANPNDPPYYDSPTVYTGFTCSALDECVLVGYYDDTVVRGGERYVISGKTFTASSSAGEYGRVACRGVGDCVATKSDGFGFDGGLSYFRGGSWTDTDSTGPDKGHLDSVACMPGGPCLAAVYYNGTTSPTPVDRIDSQQVTRIADVPLQEPVELACSATACHALGLVDGRLAAAVSDGSTWTRQDLPSTPQRASGDVRQLLCSRDDYCVARGSAPAEQLIYAGGRWRTSPSY
ncbi:hypothetical protein [Marmoricola endophyticus]|uniref:hypothetical protein n=1 Tax=Marmoricola endophyticus TaxID=2040280 RepID=UPI00166C7521|nr:hypothetical protein [Marmoricola endophyticus]